MSLSTKRKLAQWQTVQRANDYERDRLNYLRTAALPTNSPEIMKATKVRVLKPTFCIKGKQVEVDSIITMPLHEAESLKALGKIAILS